MTGATYARTFPTTPGAYQQTPATGNYDRYLFVSELDPNACVAAVPRQCEGKGLLHSTFLGGRGDQITSGLVVDAAGSVFVTGSTGAGMTTTPNAFQSSQRCTSPSPCVSAFIAKLKPDLSALDYLTYLGGATTGDSTVASYSAASGIAVDNTSGTVYVTGLTNSVDFPTTVGAYRTTVNSLSLRAFLTKLAPAAGGSSDLIYSTHLSESHSEATAVALDPSGIAYITGSAYSKDYPTTTGAVQETYPAQPGSYYGSAFVTKLNPVVRPSITSIAPTEGPTDGGTKVTITGVALTGVTGIRFGDVTAGPITVDPSGTSIVAFSPAQKQGTVHIRALPDLTEETNGNLFTYTGPPPTLVTGLSPAAGPTFGGTAVVITGTEFTNNTAVTFGKGNAKVLFDSPTKITAFSPGGPQGAVDVIVSVTKDSGAVVTRSAGQFTYGAGTWKPAGPLGPCTPSSDSCTPRYFHTATLLDGPKCRASANVRPSYCGRVLIAGGTTDFSPRFPSGVAGQGRDNGFVESQRSAELYNPASGTGTSSQGSWSPAASMSFPRAAHTATLLDGGPCRGNAPPSYCGKVLVVGGSAGNGTEPTATAELYDPAGTTTVNGVTVAGSWAPVGPLVAPRFEHTATLLDGPACRDGGGATPLYCGRVMVTGGTNYKGTTPPLASVEIYDPTTAVWTPGAGLDSCAGHPEISPYVPSSPSSCVGRVEHTATLLDGPECASTSAAPSYCGQILVAGGLGLAQGTGLAQGIAGVSNLSVRCAAPAVPGPGESAAGSIDTYVCTEELLKSAELYDPKAGTWSPTGSLNIGRFVHSATLLSARPCGSNCGKVLIAGGANNIVRNEAELYDPATGRWAATASMKEPREGHAATVLFGGGVLVVGGGGATYDIHLPDAVASAEIFDPAAGVWRYTTFMGEARGMHTATLLSGSTCQGASPPSYCGTLLAAGGSSGHYDRLVPERFARSEVYVPAPQVNALTPSGGHATGGTTVAIDGVAFTPGSTVKFDGVPATDVTVASPNRITAVSPPHAAGAVEVSVTSDSGTSASMYPKEVTRFTYDLCDVAPTAGQVAFPRGEYSLI
ncbi:MAG: IPT/TIG domain-containing protein, partial [Actinobacteria bacterium]|nr:IPT/TIG domain-containing protein [Actinomycetota bacterium]